jgi:hypothetical protein
MIRKLLTFYIQTLSVEVLTMSQSRSCSGCHAEPAVKQAGKIEKLEKGERSGNPRYPHVFVGKQAIYSDTDAQIIVTVEADDCDANCDVFTLKPARILKDQNNEHSDEQPFHVSKNAGDNCWKLHALI